jgi:hypothetical protein
LNGACQKPFLLERIAFALADHEIAGRDVVLLHQRLYARVARVFVAGDRGEHARQVHHLLIVDVEFATSAKVERGWSWFHLQV